MSIRLTVAAGAATLLTSLALLPLLLGGLWFAAGASAVIVAGGLGALTRLRLLPPALCFSASAVGLFAYLNLLFASRESWGGVVPTAASVRHLGLLVAQAAGEMAHSGPPVRASPGILLLTTSGIGLVAAATDLFAIRLRRPALAGLPLLVLFCVPLLTTSRPGPVAERLAFCLGMLGYLALLSADARYRLRLWGAPVPRWRGEPEGRSADVRPLAAAGRRIGSAAVVLALCVPMVVPGLRPHRLFAQLGGDGGPISQGVTLPSPVDRLGGVLRQGQPQTVLMYRTTDPHPLYLQDAVLGQLGTTAWTVTPPRSTVALGNGTLPPVPGLADGARGSLVHESITLAPGLTSRGSGPHYLPVPYPARSVTVAGSWRVDPASLSVFSPGASLGGLHYTVTSDGYIPSAQTLSKAPPPPASMASYLTVPRAFRSLTALAGQVTARATTSFGRALALQAWFRRLGHFTYTLNVPQPRGASALAQFLTRTKRGYCQQFAFAMAVLARLLGIPSRVVIGLTQGTLVSHDTWRVTTSDQHAWPELYFTGAGWIPFEPTPAGTEPGQAGATPPRYTGSSPAGGLTGPSLPRPVHPLTKPSGRGSGSGRRVPGPHQEPGGGTAVYRPGGQAPLLPLVPGLLAILLITPGTARVLLRRWRWWNAADDTARAHVAWRELRDDLADHRIAWQPSESPRALTRRLTGTLGLAGPAREALERVALAEERASYARRPPGAVALASDVARVRRAVAGTSGFSVRCRALVLPASVLARLRAPWLRSIRPQESSAPA